MITDDKLKLFVDNYDGIIDAENIDVLSMARELIALREVAKAATYLLGEDLEFICGINYRVTNLHKSLENWRKLRGGE